MGLIFNENFAEKNMFVSPVNSAGDPLTHTTVAMCKHQMQTYMGKCNIQTFTLYLWGQRVCDPSPFHVKAQGLRRGDTGPRTHHESHGRPKEMAEDELLLGMP